MNQVHVIVSELRDDEQSWYDAFAGAIDLYRFPRNIDAFERLSGAAAAVDLVVVTANQAGPFNLSSDQLVARLIDGTLATSSHLAGMRIVVIGQNPTGRVDPRIAYVSSMDAAIRLVKYGEMEAQQIPMPMPVEVSAPAASHGSSSRGLVDVFGAAGGSRIAPPHAMPPLRDRGRDLASSVISSIWDAGDRSATRSATTVSASAPAPVAAQRPVPSPGPQPRVLGGGRSGAAVQLVSEAAIAPIGQAIPGSSAPTGSSLFAHPEPVPAPAAAPAVAGPVVGGGSPQTVQGDLDALQPARPYVLPNGAGYRGPALRAGRVNPAAHPVPPQIGVQVEHAVYGGGATADPLLTWSRGVAPGPAPGAHPQQAAVASVSVAAPVAVATGSVAMAPQPAMAPPADPFLQRAESAGAAVSFG